MTVQPEVESSEVRTGSALSPTGVTPADGASSETGMPGQQAAKQLSSTLPPSDGPQLQPTKGHSWRFALSRRQKWLLGLLLLLSVCYGGMHLWAWYEFSQAQAAILRSDYPTARTALARCRIIWPNSEQVAVLSVRVARGLSLFPEAETFLREYRERNQNLSSSIQVEWYLLRAQQGEIEVVAPFLMECVEAGHPDSPVILETLGTIYLYLGRYRQVFVCLELWLLLEPDSVGALDLRGQAQERSNGGANAIKDYERILKLQPNRHDVHRRLVHLYLGERTLDKARNHAEYLTREEPSKPDNWVLLGRCNLEKNNYALAVKHLEHALELNPDHIPATFWLGTVALQQNDYVKAAVYLERLAQFAPSNSMFLDKWYRCLKAQNDERAPGVYKKLGRIRDLEHELQELSKKESTGGPLTTEEHLKIAEINLELGAEQVGLFRLDLVLRQNPNNSIARRMFRDFWRKKGNEEKASMYED
jgi:tetratricopeptide (TPR) repeat protein